MRFLVFFFILLVALVSAVPLTKTKIVPREPFKNGRIVGGQIARTGEFPFSVAVYFTRDGGTYFCGGAVISNLWILTAGHCVSGAQVFTLYLGSNQLTSDDPNRLTVATVNAVTHPQYNSQTLENDIGLIRLHIAIQFSEYLRPINLPSADLQGDTPVTSVGWGQTSDFGSGVVNDLNYVNLITISNDECRITYGDQIFDTMTCAVGNFDEGTCSGDTGGPLVQVQQANFYVHAGVSSFISQNGCESIDPSGYTRTYPYRNWIRDVTAL